MNELGKLKKIAIWKVTWLVGKKVIPKLVEALAGKARKKLLVTECVVLTINRIGTQHTFRNTCASVVAWQLTPCAKHILRKLRASGTGLVFQYYETRQTEYSKTEKDLIRSAQHSISWNELKATSRNYQELRRDRGQCQHLFASGVQNNFFFTRIVL